MSAWMLDRVPFSRFGAPLAISWLEGSRAPGGVKGLYLRAFHGDPQAVLRLVPLRAAQEVPVELHLEPEALTLRDAAGGAVEICFDGTATLRLRGRGGLGLRIERVQGLTMAYALGERIITFTVGIVRRYMVESLAGQLASRGLWSSVQMGSQSAADASTRKEQTIQLDLLPDADGTWEAALDEYTSTWVPRARRPFDDCRAQVQQEFTQWLALLPPAPAPYADARRLAGYIAWSCFVSPEGLLARPSMLVSKNWMAHVWGWDHCFCALPLAPGHSDLAWDQFWAIADHQDAWGAYPDAVDAYYVQYNYTESPVHGWTALELLKRAPASVSDEGLRALYGTLERWTNWWLTHRRLQGQALSHWQAWDSGWDNGTMFDQGVPLVAPDLATYLILQMEALAALAGRLGRGAEASRWQAQAEAMLAALLRELWQGDHFIARLALDGRVVEADTLQTCMPILLGMRLPEAVRAALVRRLEWLMTPWGLASEHPSSPKYTSDGYWRGPIWAPPTYFAVCGLEQIGELALARRITERYCDLCAQSGFAENWDALTGAPYRDPAYTWSMSVFLLLAERLASSSA